MDIRSAKGSLNFHNGFIWRFTAKGGNPKITKDEREFFILIIREKFPWSIYAPGKEPRDKQSAGLG